MDAFHHSGPQTEITIDRSRKPRGRRGRLTLDAKEALLRLYARGEPTSTIADRFGIDETYVRKLASRYGIRKGNSHPAGPTTRSKPAIPDFGGHLCAYKRARRGFDLPCELEPRYIRLLLAGMSSRDAARELGLTGAPHDGS